MGSYLTLEKYELSEETCMLTKQEAFWKGAWAENSSAREPGEGLCHVAHSLVFYGDGISSRLSLANPSESGPS